MGTYREGASVLYINPGTNYWGVPFRIGALPEVTVVTLHRSPVPAPTGAARVERDGAATLQPASSGVS